MHSTAFACVPRPSLRYRPWLGLGYPIASLILLFLLPGCHTNHYTNAILKTKESNGTYSIQKGINGIPYGKNAVFVPKDSRFSLTLKAINPAWIHQQVKRSLTATAFETTAFSEAEAAYMEGKDLWVLITVRTTASNDPLEFETKQISKASVVKYNMRSFGLIPLDADESTPFALEANSSYEVDMRVYEVRDVFLKRIAAETYKASPGISGLVKDSFGVANATLKTLAGDPIVKIFNKEYGTDLAVERALLEFGAVLQFRAQFSILRSTTRAVEDKTESNEYLLIDPVKTGYSGSSAGPTDHEFNDAQTYYGRLESAETVTQASLRRGDAFILLEVGSVKSPNVIAAEKEKKKAEEEAQKAKPSISPADPQVTQAETAKKAADERVKSAQQQADAATAKVAKAKTEVANSINLSNQMAVLALDMTKQQRKISALQNVAAGSPVAQDFDTAELNPASAPTKEKVNRLLALENMALDGKIKEAENLRKKAPVLRPNTTQLEDAEKSLAEAYATLLAAQQELKERTAQLETLKKAKNQQALQDLPTHASPSSTAQPPSEDVTRRILEAKSL